MPVIEPGKVSHTPAGSASDPGAPQAAKPGVLSLRPTPGAALSYPAATLTLDPLSRERLALEAPVRTGYYAEDIGDGCVNDSGFDA